MARLNLNCQPAADPVLAAAEVEVILDMYAIEDANGLPPSDDEWLGAWDIRAASRKAWEVKASKAVADVDYDADGARYSASQLHAHCIKMAERFAAQGVASVGV